MEIGDELKRDFELSGISDYPCPDKAESTCMIHSKKKWEKLNLSRQKFPFFSKMNGQDFIDPREQTFVKLAVRKKN